MSTGSAAFYAAIEGVRRGGTISLIGVYGGSADPLPMLTLFDKQIQLRMGQANVKRWVDDIMPLLTDDDPLGVDDFATHHVPLEKAPESYKMFQEKTGRGREGAAEAMTPLSRDQQAQIRIRVEERRDELRAKVEQLAESPELGSAQGFGKRVGDGTIEAVRRLTDIGVGSSLELALARAERTLAKLDEGTYGTCDSCGAAITPARLSAMPDSIHCLTCAAAQQPPRPIARR